MIAEHDPSDYGTVTTREIGNHSDLTPVRKLACAVILQSIVDCRAIYLRSGLDVLRDSEPFRAITEPYGLKYWCHVADIDYEVMAERIKRRTADEYHADNLFSELSGQGFKHDVRRLFAM